MSLADTFCGLEDRNQKVRPDGTYPLPSWTHENINTQVVLASGEVWRFRLVRTLNPTGEWQLETARKVEGQ